MHFIVKVFPEIIIKSPPVRKRFIKQLRDNLRRLLAPIDSAINVQRDWEKVEVTAPGANEQVKLSVANVLAHTPGIGSFALINSYPLGDLDDIAAKTLHHWRDGLAGKTFCVRVKRAGRHVFTSSDVERYVGGVLLHQSEAAGVDLYRPEVTVRLEVKDERLFVIASQTPGLGGFPLGSQESVLSLISGGFDSTVSTYMCMRRGLRSHYCFFNLGGREHELGVKEVAYFLWNKYGASHNVKFVTVPFEAVVAEILEKVGNAYMGVVLKRMMLRAATAVAASLDIPALVTGESVAQVSSQTLPNLNVIDRVTEALVLRPLITMDKGEIIDLSRKIGTETFAASMPEYCGVISVRPTTRARLARVEQEEGQFDMSCLQRAIDARQVVSIQDLAGDVEREEAIPVLNHVPEHAVVIDIRHPDEEERRPLLPGSGSVRKIPFFRLNTQLGELPPGIQYLLYCEKGVMSQLHAAHLKAAGHENVGVYRPD